jgi:PAS domain S-box-containing protein
MGDGEATELEVGTGEVDQFRRLVLAVRDYAIFMLDPEGHVSTWNAGAENIKGYTAAEVIGRHFSLFYTDADRERDHPGDELRIAAQTGRFEEEGWRVRKDGSYFWANVTLTAIRDDDGTLLGYAKVTRDLSSRRAADEALRGANEQLARTNRELDRFAAVAAHDLQEPLRTVAGFGDLLAGRYAGALDEQGLAYLSQITGAIRRMQSLVDDLLGFAKAGEPLQPATTVAVEDALRTVLAGLDARISETGAEIVGELEPGLGVCAHTRDLESVLGNLLSNAVKFAGADEPRVVVRGRRVGGEVRIEVADNGIGIDPAYRPRLFRPFQRLHSAGDYPGTGLGLAIAQRVVERSGGAIGVDSTAGEGSTFWFTLPAGEPEPGDAAG